MLRLIRGLWTGDFHTHVWEIISKAANYYSSKDKLNGKLPTNYSYILQCKHCGNIKSKEI